MKYKTFKDLVFEQDESIKRSRLTFTNGYGISVITGYSTYSDESQPYEVAVLLNDDVYYNSYITNDVVGYCNKRKVTRLMKQIQDIFSTNGII